MKIVYIDSQNIHRGILDYHNWIIDWKKFFIYLKEKYNVNEVKIFFGFIKEQRGLYNKLSKIGFTVCFKKALILPNGDIKGNVDIDIAIIALKDFYEYSVSKAYLVTGDGDYNSLVDFWKGKGIFGIAFIPGVKNTSILLRKSAGKELIDLIPLKNKLQKEKPSINT